MVYCKDLSFGKIYFWLFLKAANLRKRILTNSWNKTINKEHTTWVQEHALHSRGTRVHPRFFSSGVHVCSIFSFQSKCFVDHCLSFCPFSFSHCNACPSLIYKFWLPIRYLQTFITNSKQIIILPTLFTCYLISSSIPSIVSIKAERIKISLNIW